MITHQIADAMAEVREAKESLDDDSIQWELMSEAHTALALAHSLVHMVNAIQLAELVNGDG